MDFGPFQNIFTQERAGCISRIHPGPKTRKLYGWLLANYAKPGDRIPGTHLQRLSAIAAHYGGFDFVGCELGRRLQGSLREI